MSSAIRTIDLVTSCCSLVAFATFLKYWAAITISWNHSSIHLFPCSNEYVIEDTYRDSLHNLYIKYSECLVPANYAHSSFVCLNCIWTIRQSSHQITASSRQMCPGSPLFFCPGGKYKGFENCDVDSLIWTVKSFTIISHTQKTSTHSNKIFVDKKTARVYSFHDLLKHNISIIIAKGIRI